MSETVIAGRYKLEDLLGHGGMSEVYCAEDLELGRRVALKLLAPDADTARFEREARAVAALAHPNVMQVYDYGEDDGRPYMVLEYVPGGTLEEKLAGAKGKPLPDAETSAIAAGMAAGLAHAHARGVIHRDLKPANVLFDDEGRPKLADFGIARMAAGEGTLTEAGTVLGTAAYISPEQASGAPATAASDVYSFGVMLYRMVTGRLPFESNDPMELVMMNRDQPPPPITSLRKDAPGLLESTTMAALEKDPAERPHNGAALLAALGAAGATATTMLAGAGAAGATATTMLAGAGAADATRVLPVAPPATGTAYAEVAPPPPPGRSRLPLLAAALLVLLLAGGALAYELTKSNSPGTPTGTTLPSITISTKSTTQKATTQATTTTPSTTTPTTQTTTTQATTTQPATTRQRPTTAQVTTTAPPPPTTTAPPPTTTAPPPTTFTQPTTTGP